MTLGELDTAVEGKRIIRHRGQVFFTTYDSAEAARFQKMGAYLRADLLDELGQATRRTFWEVFLYSMLDPDSEVDEEGNEVDLRPAKVLDYFRARDGDALGLYRGATS